MHEKQVDLVSSLVMLKACLFFLQSLFLVGDGWRRLVKNAS